MGQFYVCHPVVSFQLLVSEINKVIVDQSFKMPDLQKKVMCHDTQCAPGDCQIGLNV